MQTHSTTKVSTEISVFWFAVSCWQRFASLTPDEQKEAALAADDVLNRYPPGSAVSEDIQHFGPCSYNKCVAIASVFIVSRAKTDHVDSPFLRAARDARMFLRLAGEIEPPAVFRKKP